MTGITNPLKVGLARYFSQEQLDRLASAHIGLAGAGGLGSNTAMMLARSGIGQLTIVDCDVVEPSNLNRQQFWPRHLGMAKVDALAGLLRELNPDLAVKPVRLELDKNNLDQILPACRIWVEALDAAETKALFVSRALAAGHLVVAASGMGGYGGPSMRKRVMGRLTVVGDFCTDIASQPPLAPRVTQAAAMLADVVLELVLNKPMAGSENK